MLFYKRTSLLLLIGFLLFHFICADRPVVLSCGGDERERAKGDPGAPGKRGAAGPPGPVGPKGNAAEVDNITREAETLNQVAEYLQRQIRAIPVLHHFRLPATAVTWSKSKQFCENNRMMLCTKAQIFSYGDVPFGIGVQQGDHWVPVRDASNEWTQIGTAHPLGVLLVERYGAHSWSEQVTSNSFKGHVFCCTVA